MKFIALVGMGALALLASSSLAENPAFRTVYTGQIPVVHNNSPKWWAISGYYIVHISQRDGNMTPIMRTEEFDARTVEILSRTEAPPLRGSDIRAVGSMVVVRDYLLMQVRPQDAQAVNMSQDALAQIWAKSVRKALLNIAPQPGRLGV